MSQPIDPGLELAEVKLSVADLDRSARYYTEAIGLSIVSRTDRSLVVGAGSRPLLELVHEPGVRSSIGFTGLFHFAILLPGREQFAGWFRHALTSDVQIDGMSDHTVSEALYLTDPDGHGIEIYWDRDPDLWRGKVSEVMGTLPLKVDEVLAQASEFEGVPEGTRIGHVHLRAAAIPETVDFYTRVLGFTLTATIGNQAAFFAAGDYHHHFAANTWQSLGASAAPVGTARLLGSTVIVPDATAIAQRLESNGVDFTKSDNAVEVADPSGNLLIFRSG